MFDQILSTYFQIVSQNEASLHNIATFEFQYDFQKYKINKKINIASKFPETIFLSKKKLYPHTRTYIFVHWIILENETLLVQSHQRIKAQFITIVTGNSHSNKLSFKPLVSQEHMHENLIKIIFENISEYISNDNCTMIIDYSEIPFSTN